MWNDVVIRVTVASGAGATWAAAIPSARRVGFGRTAKEALHELEQLVDADLRGEGPEATPAARRYFDGQ